MDDDKSQVGMSVGDNEVGRIFTMCMCIVCVVHVQLDPVSSYYIKYIVR